MLSSLILHVGNMWPHYAGEDPEPEVLEERDHLEPAALEGRAPSSECVEPSVVRESRDDAWISLSTLERIARARTSPLLSVPSFVDAVVTEGEVALPGGPTHPSVWETLDVHSVDTRWEPQYLAEEALEYDADPGASGRRVPLSLDELYARNKLCPPDPIAVRSRPRRRPRCRRGGNESPRGNGFQPGGLMGDVGTARRRRDGGVSMRRSVRVAAPSSKKKRRKAKSKKVIQRPAAPRREVEYDPSFPEL